MRKKTKEDDALNRNQCSGNSWFLAQCRKLIAFNIPPIKWISILMYLVLVGTHFTCYHSHLLPHPDTSWYMYILRWRHNWHDGVSNHQPHNCLLNRVVRRRSKKTSKPRVTGPCVGSHRSPVNSRHKWPVTRKNFHLMTSSWISWFGLYIFLYPWMIWTLFNTSVVCKGTLLLISGVLWNYHISGGNI